VKSLNLGDKWSWAWKSEVRSCASSTWSGIDQTQAEFSTRVRGQLSEIKTIQVHHLGPGRYEIAQELLLRIRASIHFSQCP
jgi:hypothetical protein